MKRSLVTVCLAMAAMALSGCYYDPDYSYVRSTGSQGDVYYGRSAPVYYDNYYAAPGYYNYYGCCYGSGVYGPGVYRPGVSVGISRTWYGGARYHHDDHRRHGGHAHRGGRPVHRGNHRDHRENHPGSDRRGHDGHQRHRGRGRDR